MITWLPYIYYRAQVLLLGKIIKNFKFYFTHFKNNMNKKSQIIKQIEFLSNNKTQNKEFSTTYIKLYYS